VNRHGSATVVAPSGIREGMPEHHPEDRFPSGWSNFCAIPAMQACGAEGAREPPLGFADALLACRAG